MKRLASFLMIGVFITSFTWAQATIPDTKENSKTEMLAKVHTVKMENQMNVEFLVSIVRNEDSAFDVILKDESKVFAFKSADVYKEKVLLPVKPQIFNYRKARDGI